MLKSVVAVVSGFVIWSVLWLSYNVVLKKASVLPTDTTAAIGDAKALLLLLIGSVVMSVVAGYATAAIARSASYAPILVLGLVLLAVGIVVQAQYWRLMPLWYHLSFLILLLPLCYVGAWLRLRNVA